MEIDALIRSICLRDRHYMFFLGAGASITSGVPSAWECIWNWKLSIFLTKNSQINPTLLGNATLPHVQHRVQKWLDQQGTYPPANSAGEYSFYAEACFPYANDRRDEFRRIVAKANPYIGYKLLDLLIEAGKIKWVLTTNFDDLVERGLPSNRQRPFLQVGLDSVDRLTQVRRESEDAIQIFLHGDYRYDTLKNTDTELQALDKRYLEKLIELTSDLPLVVVGYSGRDKSVMEALTCAYSKKVNGGLFWLWLDNSELSTNVLQLIEQAKRAGNNAEVVYFSGFDDFIVRLARYWLKDLPEHIIVENTLKALPVKRGFNVNHLSPDFNWILGNAYPIELPCELFQFAIKGLPEKGAWQKLREIVGTHPINCGLFKGKVLALGKIADIKLAFGQYLTSKIEQISLTNQEYSIANTAIYEILLKSFVDSLVERGADRFGKYTLALPTELVHEYRGIKYKYKESMRFSFDVIAENVYLLTVPDIKFLDEGLSNEVMKSVKRDILWRQRNKEYFNTVKNWRDLLFKKDNKWNIIFPPKSETGFEFKVNPNVPVCTRVYSAKPNSGSREIEAQFKSYEKFKAFTIDEPYLRFRDNDDSSHPSKSIHPIKGLIDCGGPIERYDKTIHPSADIRVAMVCLTGHESNFIRFLQQLRERISPNSETDYLIDFPGFKEAFKCELSLPSSNNQPEWKSLPSIPQEDSISMNQRATKLIIEKIKELESSAAFDLVVIYIPSAWAAFEKIVTDDIHLDLHDQIKAFCVERGIRTQLIRESKVKAGNSCKMRWWLSLAFFTKALRTPWMLEPTGEKVAYVGIGYAIDHTAKDGHIVLGCSHVFDSHGLGMQFRLGRLQKPIWLQDPFSKQKNPFMSKDDAYMLGNRTRQLFYETHQSLPDRVMVCKKTPFLQSEIDGLLSALSGIRCVDLLTIQHDDIWRYCAYNSINKEVHGFPVKRGTGLVLEDSKMLLWLHGTVPRLKDNSNYFQGKSRIPTPVRVTRYSGETPVETIAGELLALTKMDWNTFALYKQMPATVTTPNVIARIGRLLNRLTAESYDYRLFM